MPVWVIPLLVGILIVAAIVLVVAVHILDVHAEQQCAHLHDLKQRSLQQSQNHYQYRCGESHLCCVCGSVRYRRSQASSGSAPTPQSKGSFRTGSAGGLLQPLVDAACRKKSIGSSGSIERLTGNSRKPHGMASGLQGGWFNARNIFRGTGSRRESGKKSDVDSAPLATADSSSSGSSASSGRTAGSSTSSSMTTITATITTTSAPSSNSSPSNAGMQATGTQGTDDGVGKPSSQRRYVLEILMSPSGAGDGQGGSGPRATGVRLKLETSASLESLAGLAAAASSGAASSYQSLQIDTDAEGATLTAGYTTAAYGPQPAFDFIGSTGVPSPAGKASRTNSTTHCKLGSLQSSIASVSNLDGQKNESNCQGSSADLYMPSTAARKSGECSVEKHECSTEPTICISSVNRRPDIDCGATHGSIAGNIPSGTAAFSAPSKRSHSGQAIAVATEVKSKSKNGNSNSSSSVCSHTTLLHGVGSSGSNPSNAKGSQHQTSISSSQDGLGSLRISVLDGDTKGKSMKDCSKGVLAEIASALAALNVESVGGKGVGISSAPGVGGVPSDESSMADKLGTTHDEEVPGNGSGSERLVEEKDEHEPVTHSGGGKSEENEVDEAKKEKKKKKNRGRRQRAKAAAAATASVQAQGRLHSHEKTSTKPAVKVSAVSEVEVGCTCGAPKGSCHSIRCPYPFTSSGSMVQSKIKEQYDELVKSNMAKSLTLAQVGRFTTCLVEAKTSLQQKSDTIQRRFTIAKSLLAKADKSSFDRLCGQIYGLEIEQKKLEEDTVVYNRLQEQLKLSPAYQKMLEYGRTHFELQPNTGQLIEKVDTDEMEISFEELLAQEKKDSFWQKQRPSRSSVQVS
ncbi:hypothetical protein R1flu_020179 [Riccia fluitans]|uniref:Uncharacterized protein n=1 Tax=Riccia fluitans TaxID=41844 RepID=A0ABD1ZKS3_9MARC